jgi:predicted metalloprotease with PDZ domain
MVDYRVEVEDPNAHLFRVTLTLDRPDSAQEFSLPVWAPGSYMVRDFVRHLSGLTAQQGGQRREVESIGKSRWRVVDVQGAEPLVLNWSVYAFDPSVRGAFLDADRGFFNGSSLLLRAEGRWAETHRLQLAHLPQGWGVATSMAPAGDGRFEAADYAELIDHPFELGRFWRGGFEVGGVPHDLVVSGAWPGFDSERLLADTRRICEALVGFWHPRGAPPFRRYLFLLQARDDGYGGLEHRDSCALVCARRDLPRSGDAAPDRSEGAVALLALISHEYFHAWNVKRLQPAAFLALDLEHENPERLLWFFEGFTAYYDELLLCRAGLIDAARYLRLLAKAVNTLRGTPGRKVQSVAQASFDAWTRSYRADENTPNVTVSYYTKGALLALCCDLHLRARGQGSIARRRDAPPVATPSRGRPHRGPTSWPRCRRWPALRCTKSSRPGCTAPPSCQCRPSWRLLACAGAKSLSRWPGASGCACPKMR